jgi:hypothetical protein
LTTLIVASYHHVRALIGRHPMKLGIGPLVLVVVVAVALLAAPLAAEAQGADGRDNWC